MYYNEDSNKNEYAPREKNEASFCVHFKDRHSNSFASIRWVAVREAAVEAKINLHCIVGGRGSRKRLLGASRTKNKRVGITKYCRSRTTRPYYFEFFDPRRFNTRDERVAHPSPIGQVAIFQYFFLIPTTSMTDAL